MLNHIHGVVLSLFIAGASVSLNGRFAAAEGSPPRAADSEFVSIFDGKTLDGWEGDPKYWRVEDGCLVGEVTPETLLKQNSFIVWRGGTTRDF